jgi:hypothetical protein
MSDIEGKGCDCSEEVWVTPEFENAALPRQSQNAVRAAGNRILKEITLNYLSAWPSGSVA